MDSKMDFYAAYNFSSMSIDIHATVKGNDGRRSIAKGVVFEDLGSNAKWMPPMLSLDKDAAGRLMTELWNAGVRPADIGTAGQLGATERHLKDMRLIVAKKLGVDL